MYNDFIFSRGAYFKSVKTQMNLYCILDTVNYANMKRLTLWTGTNPPKRRNGSGKGLNKFLPSAWVLPLRIAATEQN